MNEDLEQQPIFLTLKLGRLKLKLLVHNLLPGVHHQMYSKSEKESK